MDAEETAATLPFKQLVDAMEEVLRDKVAGRITAPVPSVTPLDTVGTLETTTFIDGDVAVVDVRTLHPANPSGGQPFVQGSVLLHDVRTGRLLRTLDGTTFTARRAAAVSALAARVLAPDPTGRMLVIGAGTLARAHMEAFHEALGTSEAFVLSRSEHRALQAVEFARRIGMRSRVVDLSTATVDYVTLIVTATTSVTPIVFGRVRDDGFVAAVGSYRADMAELPDELVHRGFLFIDNPEQAHMRAGDFINAGIDLSTVFPLEAVLDAARPAAGPVVFENCGDYLFDIATVRTSLAVKPPTPEEWGREPTQAEAEVLRPERIALPRAQPGQLPRGGPIEMGPADGAGNGATSARPSGGPGPIASPPASTPEPSAPIVAGSVSDETTAPPEPPEAEVPVAEMPETPPVFAPPNAEPPVVDAPVAEQSPAEQPVAQQVAPEQTPEYEPVAEQTVAEEPVVHEPVAPPVFAPPVEQPPVDPPVVQEPVAPPVFAPPVVQEPVAPPVYAPPVEQPVAQQTVAPAPAFAPPVFAPPSAQQPVDPNLPPLAPPQPDVAVPAWAPPQFGQIPSVPQPQPAPPAAYEPPPVYEPPSTPGVDEQPVVDPHPVVDALPADGAQQGSDDEPAAPQWTQPADPTDPDGGRVWVPPVN